MRWFFWASLEGDLSRGSVCEMRKFAQGIKFNTLQVVIWICRRALVIKDYFEYIYTTVMK